MLDVAMDAGVDIDPRTEEAMDAEQDELADDDDHVSWFCLLFP